MIDQSADGTPGRALAARNHASDLRSNPAAGTPVMASVTAGPPSDLPLKVLVWDDNGQTKVSYYSPEALAARR